MKRLRRRHDGQVRAIDLTPLVDVALMLVVFLLLAADFIERYALPVQLPQADAAGAERPTGALELTVLADGSVFHGDERLADDAAIADAVSGRQRVIVRGDADCRLGSYVDLIDALLAAGIDDIDLATESAARLEEW